MESRIEISNQKFSSLNIGTRIKDYLKLIKVSLSIMVVFSSVISYLLAPKVVEYDVRMIIIIQHTFRSIPEW